jgi:hypothetical protein
VAVIVDDEEQKQQIELGYLVHKVHCLDRILVVMEVENLKKINYLGTLKKNIKKEEKRENGY